ncbi:v-type atpase 116kda subunit family protein [Stylonychia lemnae]|uniref:V-type proton ATPase subunit a n=1 Tax=Stylonychia lemnae TaxID=5949 RepID=A0A077ZPQ9_STYLE|nr:v-type atpase 116kda subunit family protein [Stylonychia lemnae]|eukprot:CDW71883.1 v-type atpase 116kda subunit family protein [Stylonychia lemnae]
MSLFRSQDVDLYEILIPKDNDWDIMNELGNINCLHFINLNKNEQPHHLRYFNQVKRCEESESMIKEIEDICAQYKVDLKTPADIDVFLQQANLYSLRQDKAAHLLFNDIENDLKDKSAFLKSQVYAIDNMITLFRTIVAKINILQYASQLFEQSDKSSLNLNSDFERDPMLTYGRQELRSPLMSEQSRIAYLGGVLKKSEQMSFKKLIFRATRGKALINFYELKISDTDKAIFQNEQEKMFVYLIMFDDGQYIRDKIYRICSSSQEPTKKSIKDYLIKINKMQGAEYSLLEIYKCFILKEKSIYIELNKLKFSEKILMGLLWCPTKFRQALDEKLDDIRNKRNLEGPQMHLIKDYDEKTFQRPTYFETNEFTWPFQEIVNTYGIPQYQEVNPAIFTLVSFPFLFGVMFGDVLHGTLLFVFSSYLCFYKPKEGSLISELYKIRYLLLLMGFFSSYCGFIYNDFTSIPLNLFGRSCYNNNHKTHQSEIKQDCIYQVGVDPTWYFAKNELSFLNSLKMKISVILGVSQMSLGVFMKAFNSLKFKRYIDFTFEFLPQIILLWSLFGFMDLMIITKWLTNYDEIQGARPPSVITQMIVMCLNFGSQNEGPQRESELFNNQTIIMRILLFISLICVPLMLFVKPLYENNINQKRYQSHIRQIHEEEGEKHYTAINDEPISHEGRGKTLNQKSIDIGSIEKHKQHSFSDLFIHQLIETIEFVLGTISNTASYLRLWALSLAHSQLAKVFFDNTIKSGLQSNSFVAVTHFLLIVLVVPRIFCVLCFYNFSFDDDGFNGSILAYLKVALG